MRQTLARRAAPIVFALVLLIGALALQIADVMTGRDVELSRSGLDIEFRFRNPEAPLYAGAGAAPLYLGLAVRSIIVRPAMVK